jgi:sulfite reductase (NADPH) hemoprotein beta-component
MTANQNLIVAGVPADQKDIIEKIAREHGLIDGSHSEQRFNSMACVALPTCPLAMAEAERYLPELIEKTEAILAKHEIPNDDIIMRGVGCPNGCGRAMLAEIGFVGKGPGKYTVYLGGNREGTRVPKLYLENVGEDVYLPALDELIGQWAIDRNEGECFGDFAIRKEIVAEVKVSKTDFHA